MYVWDFRGEKGRGRGIEALRRCPRDMTEWCTQKRGKRGREVKATWNVD